jgi:hypothetical protein
MDLEGNGSGGLKMGIISEVIIDDIVATLEVI